MMLGARSGIGCFLGVSLGCCQSSGTRAFWVRPPVSGPRHLQGTVPSPPYQGPRHLWLGTEAPPLCRLCGCSDHGEGVAHAGSAVRGGFCACLGRLRPFSPPQTLSAWGVGVSAPSQPGQSCGRWSPRQMRPIARMRLHLWVRPQLPDQRPHIQLLQNWFPFGSVAACLLPSQDTYSSGGGSYPSLCSQVWSWTSACSCPSEVVRSPWMSWLVGGPWKTS